MTVNVISNCGFFSGDVLLFFNYIPFFRTHAPLLDQGNFNLLMNRISIDQITPGKFGNIKERNTGTPYHESKH